MYAVWKVNFPTKVNIMVRLIHFEGLNSTIKLQKKMAISVMNPSNCSLCLKVEKKHNHPFSHYSYGRKFWVSVSRIQFHKGLQLGSKNNVFF